MAEDCPEFRELHHFYRKTVENQERTERHGVAHGREWPQSRAKRPGFGLDQAMQKAWFLAAMAEPLVEVPLRGFLARLGRTS
jgi:hypothetical protein